MWGSTPRKVGHGGLREFGAAIRQVGQLVHFVDLSFDTHPTCHDGASRYTHDSPWVLS